MPTFLVVFHDKGNCDIADVTVDSNHIVFAAALAHQKIMMRDGVAKAQELNRDTDSLTVEQIS